VIVFRLGVGNDLEAFGASLPIVFAGNHALYEFFIVRIFARWTSGRQPKISLRKPPANASRRRRSL